MPSLIQETGNTYRSEAGCEMARNVVFKVLGLEELSLEEVIRS